MIQTVTAPLFAKRWTPFVDHITIKGVDLTAAALSMQVRLYRDAPGDPLIALGVTTAPTQGLSVSVTTTDGIPTSIIEIRIDEATIEGLLPFVVTDGAPNRKAGSDVDLVWDIHITPTWALKDRWFEGPFTIQGGATH